MNALPELPPVLVGAVALFVVLGAAFALLGSIGLVRLPTFYERTHPPTMGTTFGVALVCTASMLLFSFLEGRIVVHQLVLGLFVVVTTPITFTLLVRAAVRRDDLAEDRATFEQQHRGTVGRAGAETQTRPDQ